MKGPRATNGGGGGGGRARATTGAAGRRPRELRAARPRELRAARFRVLPDVIRGFYLSPALNRLCFRVA